jgi:hypothetical protein
MVRIAQNTTDGMLGTALVVCGLDTGTVGEPRARSRRPHNRPARSRHGATGATNQEEPMKNIAKIMVVCIATLVARQATADCKLILLVDRTGSMVAPSTTSTGKTRCQVAQDAVLQILSQYSGDMDFALTNPMPGGTTRFAYTTNCPMPSQRLVQVWEFQGNIMQRDGLTGYRAPSITSCRSTWHFIRCSSRQGGTTPA